MKNTTIGIFTFCVLLLISGFIFLPGKITSSAVQEKIPTGDYQEISISSNGLTYQPNPILVKAGQPVRVRLDSSVQGCLRSLSIPAFGVNKYLPKPTDSVIFTPTTKGSYPFTCAMGMGRGRIIVE